MIRTYPTQGILNAKQAESLHAKLMYSIEGISDCRLDHETGDIIVHSLTDEHQEMDATIQRLMEKERSKRLIGTRIYTQSETTEHTNHRESEEIEACFAANGSLKRGIAVTLMQQIDRLVTELSLRYRAELRQYPSMIPLATLNRCGYIPTFPQNVHLVSEFPHRLPELEKVRGMSDFQEVARLSPYALSPAVCFHCYAELSGTRLNEPLVLTARGTCFRHEAAWRLGKHRLNEFSMRETVLFGDSEFVETKRKQFMEDVWELFESLGLRGSIITATDPFYFSEENGKGQQQMMGNMKYELIVDTEKETSSFSIASFNNMDKSLCKPFEVLGPDGSPLHSGCIAFGIDRWVYALLSYYGPTLSHWPSVVRSTLERTYV